MTLRIQPFFEIWLIEINFSNMTHTMKLFSFIKWLKELNLHCFWKRLKELIFLDFFNVTQRIELFEFDSKNWTFFFKKKMTHRIETSNFEPFLKILLIIWHFVNMTQRIELLNKKRTMTQRIEPIFNTTRSIDFFKQKDKELNPFFLTKNEF